MNRPWDEDDKDRDRCLMFRPVNEKLAPIIRIPLSSGHNSCKIRCYACLGQEILCLTFGIVFLMKMESRLNGKCLKLLYVSVINCWLKDSDGASHIPNLKCYTVVNGESFSAGRF